MAVTTISGLNTQIGRNHLINGEFSVAQRGATITAPNDDVYTLDRWNLVSEGNDIVDVTQTTTVPTGGALKSIGLDVETANKQFGIVQIIEAKNCTGLIGNEVTFSFKAKVSNVRLGDVRAGIIAWSSTADSVTSDVVATYNDDANPTLASNLTFENTPSDLGVTTSWVTYSVTATGSSGSGCNNFAVFIWSDVSDTTLGDFLYITDCQLEQGSNATPFERRGYGDELTRCQRYCIAIKTPGTTGGIQVGQGQLYNTTFMQGPMMLPAAMRVPPVIVSTGDGTMQAYSGGAGDSCGPVIVDGPGQLKDTTTISFSISNLSIGSAGQAVVFRTNGDSSYIYLESEL